MKKTIMLASLLSLMIFTQAQDNSELSNLLNNYYAIKNALVAGDASKAATLSGEFATTANTIDLKKMSPSNQKAVQPVQQKLVSNAKLIAATKEISKQRELFAAFSNDMISLAKAAKLSDTLIYIDYCPMKKTYWLSAEQPIKNPYYGNSMLTCGNVTDSLK